MGDTGIVYSKKLLRVVYVLLAASVVALCIVFVLWSESLTERDLQKRDYKIIRDKLQTTESRLEGLLKQEAEFLVAKEKLKAAENLDRKCIASYIKDRYTSTPTVIASSIAEITVDICRKHQVPIPLVVGIMETESNFNPYAKSNKNARGLMQVMFSVWGEELSIPSEATLHEIREGIEYGILVFKRYLDQSDNNLSRALWLYNGRDVDKTKYANLVFTNVGRYILHKCHTSYKMEEFSE